MENKIKVLLADNSEHFGIPCANVMRSHGLDVETVEKTAASCSAVSSVGIPTWLSWISFCPASTLSA